MLKLIPPIISPELMLALMRMGHGDEIVLADGNFPADSHAQRIIRADGHGVADLLDAILMFMPLDTFVPSPAFVMAPVDDSAQRPSIWSDYTTIIRNQEGTSIDLMPIERFAFYERTKQAYAIVATSDSALYANLILKKGVVFPD